MARADRPGLTPRRRHGLLLAGATLFLLACSSKQADPCGGCPAQQACLSVPLDDGGVLPACGALSQAFGPCGPSIPAACADSSLTCIGFGGASGFCYQLCDPVTPVCATGLSCLAVLDSPDAGICAKTAPSGTPCDQSQQLFCPAGQICLGTVGTCLRRCDPAQASCPQLESCVTPSPFDPGLSICVQPQSAGSSCSPPQNVYCDNGTFCVYVSPDAGQGQCLLDCTDGGACPAPQTCRSISGQGLTLDLGVCY